MTRPRRQIPDNCGGGSARAAVPGCQFLDGVGLKHLARALKWDASAPFRHLECVPRLFSNCPEGARAGRDGGGLWGRHGLAMAVGPIAEITQIGLCCVAGAVPVMNRPGAKRSRRRWRVERSE
jgi:hypothetical protein